jgi:non-ribosomal peptide synthase protein (TIGR01720 family)
MVPSAVVVLESLPLNANGKVDRQALRPPQREAARDSYEAPRTPAEETLARIWRQVLRLERLGIHDNFFALGGDSILSIQIVARASQAGLRVTPMQVFQHQTVAELASVAGTTPEGRAEQGLVTGEVPLTPVQRWFFELELEEPHHFNHAVLLRVQAGLDAGVLEAAVRALEEHHDALRLRFERGALGWKQEIAGPSGVGLLRVDLTGVRPGGEGPAIGAVASEVHRGLDLSRGPLWRVALLDLGRDQPGRLLIVIHHLAVDGVSWRVLLEDLQAACEQLSRGESPTKPPKTTSFKTWSERLVEYAESGGASGELAYWRAVAVDPARLPVDHPGGDERNTVATRRTVSVVLGEENTRALLKEVHAAYRTEIQDVLLTALVDALAGWTGRDELLIDLEGHGREDLFEGVDLSRTVGWFTTICPVRLKRVAGGPGEALRGVKEQLRRIPHRGIGFGVLRYLQGEELRSGAQVSFNYLGQFDQALGDTGLLAPAPESSGRAFSERGRRPHLIEVSGLVSGRRLLLEWAYSEAVHERRTVEALARSFVGSLSSLIAHCRGGVRGYTPSDFPLAGLDAKGLERILGTSRGGEP